MKVGIIKTQLMIHQLRNLGDFSDPGEARTLDPMIKSHLLYQLSYGVISQKCDAKLASFFYLTK